MSIRTTSTEPHPGFPGSSFKYTPLKHLRVLFLEFAQGLFGSAPPGAYHWSEDPNLSEIHITDESPVHVETAGQRPAISFTRGAIQFTSLGFDDTEEYKFSSGAQTRTVLVPGNMTVNISSRVDIESEQLAWIFAEHFWLLRQVLRQQGFFDIGRNLMISAPTKGGEVIVGDGADEWYTTSVLCPFQFNRSSTFTPLGQQIVENIATRLSTMSRRVSSLGAPVGGEAGLPVQIVRERPEGFAPNASDAYGGTPNPTQGAPDRSFLMPRRR